MIVQTPNAPSFLGSSVAIFMQKHLFVIALVSFFACCSLVAFGFDNKTYSEVVAQDKPIAYYPILENDFVDTAELRNAANASNSASNGIVKQSLKMIDGPIGVGKAINFDGTGYIEIPHDAVFNSDELSVEFWFRSTQVWDQKYWPASATLISKFTSGWASSDWGILGGSLNAGTNEGRVLVGVGPKNGGDVVLASNPGLNDGRFHHVVWTHSRLGENILYVDSSVHARARDHGTSISNTRAIQVGGEMLEPNGTFLDGAIAALAIYAYPLNDDRIQAHFMRGQFDPRLPPAVSVEIDFEREIKPIFQEHCYECHGPGQDKGGFSLANGARAMDGGESGKMIFPRMSSVSPLVKWIAALDENKVMPPDDEQLSDRQVGLIRAWIDQGAVWPSSADEVDPRLAKATDHWSFKPLNRPSLPTQAHDDWVANPIDAFILSKLNEAKLRPTIPASKTALLRRVYFDLTGLPPSVEDIQSFLRDDRPEAYANVVDHLLETTAYGERWARHWLDVVRYADSGGFETDIFYEQAWRYRDYVIRSFQEDKPYDRFLQEQVAGDELWPADADVMQDAVAIWTLGQWPNALDKFPEMLEYTRRTDQVVTLCESMLGLTVGCANCHDHKFDPITQRDYFGLEAIFAASETWDRNTNKKQWSNGERNHYRILRHASFPTPIHLLSRGELTKPRGLISPSLPAFLPGGGPVSSTTQVDDDLRRAHLARWLVSPQNPLTARVIANRIWQWHFGRALAATPNDLGLQGQKPTHPELLDWLAAEFVEKGWRLKPLHRLMVMSSTYQQSALREAEAIQIDPENLLLSGFSRRRLEAEEVWDHLHKTAGTLDLKSFGIPFVPKLTAEELQGIYDIEGKLDKKWPVSQEQNRRAIYILNRRSFRFPFFTAFDPANSSVSCPIRQSTTVPAQALTLLNNSIVSEEAKRMAERIKLEAGNDKERCVCLAWLLAFSREVTNDELRLSLDFLTKAQDSNPIPNSVDAQSAALVEFCLGIMNTTEFIYVN